MAGPEGNAVYAVDSGVVVYSGWSEYGYGNLIVLDHGTGWQSAYAHLAGVGVTCGQSVAQGGLPYRNAVVRERPVENFKPAALHRKIRAEFEKKEDAS